jgi:hypothetical protein
MLPNAYDEAAEQDQKCAESEQPAPGAAATGITAARHQLDVLQRRRTFQHAMIEIGHQISSAKTPCAGLPSLRLRSMAKR